MKRMQWTACLLSLVLLLTACGQTATVENGGTSTDNAQKAVSAPADMSDVENNGGMYVRVGDRVYFRKYGLDALETSAMFGNFAADWNTAGGESEIMFRDLKTGAVKTAFKDTGYNGLYVADDSFYLQECVNHEDYVVRYSPDGKTCETVQKGSLVGITDSGLLAIQQYEGDTTSFYFYRDGKEIGSYQSEADYTYAGLSDDGLFLLNTEDRSETAEGGGFTCALWQLTPDGETLTRLGTLPQIEYTYGAMGEQFISSGTQVGLIVGYYAGTGHALNDVVVVTAKPGVEDSLTVLDSDVYFESDSYVEVGYLPRLSIDEGGDIVLVPYLSGAVQIGAEDDDAGDLEIYDDNAWRTIIPQFVAERADGSGYQQISQTLEYVGDTVYVTLANAYASPVDDIGWRSSFKLLNMAYLAISAQGEQQELCSVDYDSALQGNAWFQADAETLLLQQTTSEEDAWQSEAEGAFLIPIASDAVWDDQDAILSDAVYAELDGEPDYNGWAIPDTEGQFLCVRLNRDGEAVYLTTKSPDALLTIDVGVEEAELSDTVENISLTPRPSDEDSPWYWSRLTALESGVTLLIERTPDAPTDVEEFAMIDGEFVPGSTLFRRVMERGESVGLYASLPWHAEIRVSVMRNGDYGAYVFGEDNHAYEEPVNGRFAQKILAAYSEQENSFTGSWLYRDPESGQHTARVDIMDDVVGVNVEDTYYVMTGSMEHLYTEEWETPDLLCLTTEDADTLEALNMSGDGVGDYLVERFQTDGESILYLRQMNNGDAALDILIPHQSNFLSDVVLHSYHGTAEPVAPPRNITLTAKVVKVEKDSNIIWLREAEAYEWDELVTIYCVKPHADCVACPLSSPDLLDAFEAEDPEYPMQTFQVTIDRDGLVTALDPLS